MILSLRQAIYKKMEPKSVEDLSATIADAIEGDERALPGLGVLFEVLWKNSDKESQDKMVESIRAHLPQQ
ncbi:small acid-soluble spore protein SspI [Paenibacillus sp.]|uniref:small acid-soluble spore protein SspI n=1 Tax=Paenibacillus sp. TaxID=58172 RepID=UPI002D3DB159|nr:small acid-soluble spore protein SspI [Paenibacillus sp.]HZG55236.1 small acid-soluble spore protein SspI [Paenibacillus sp.]